MISDISDFAISGHNGRPARATGGTKTPERSGWELLAWAILEQAVDDLATFCRYGIISPTGKCLPWPFEMKPIEKYGPTGKLATYWHRVHRSIASSHGPNDHRELVAWFKSEHAQSFCDLIGCKLPATEIFAATVKNHGGLKK
jgi:hypothetical protein